MSSFHLMHAARYRRVVPAQILFVHPVIETADEVRHLAIHGSVGQKLTELERVVAEAIHRLEPLGIGNRRVASRDVQRPCEGEL